MNCLLPPAEDKKKGGGGLKGGGVWLGPPSSQGPPKVPAEGGPKIFNLKSSWHRRGRSKTLAVSLKHWKGRRGGGPGGGGAPPAVYGRSNTVRGPPAPRAHTPAHTGAGPGTPPPVHTDGVFADRLPGPLDCRRSLRKWTPALAPSSSPRTSLRRVPAMFVETLSEFSVRERHVLFCCRWDVLTLVYTSAHVNSPSQCPFPWHAPCVCPCTPTARRHSPHAPRLTRPTCEGRRRRRL